MAQAITDTITGIKISRNKGFFVKKTCVSVLPALMLTPVGAIASELDVKTNISASYVAMDVDSQETSESSSRTLEVTPFIGAIYRSKRLYSSLNLAVQHVDRDFSGVTPDETSPDSTEDYVNYDYNLNFEAIENMLTLTANGRRALQNLNPANALTNSIYYGADQLSTTVQHSGGFDFGLPRGKYVGFVVSGNYSDLSSETQLDRIRPLDTNNTNLVSRLFSGRDMKGLNFEFTHQYTDTEVNEGPQNDLLSRTLSGSISFPIYEDFRLLVEGRSEENTYRGDAGLDSGALEYDSAGIGFAWKTSPEKFINLTYNRSEGQDGEEDDEFLGATVNWRFSPRTVVRADYGKRFFGETGNFTLSHDTRKLRTRVTYGESLTTYTRLFTEEVDLGTFVCPADSTGIGDCFQPDGADYELQPGESFTGFTSLNPDLREEVILRKELFGSVGYQFRRVRATLSYRHADVDYLESDQATNDETVALLLNMKVGSRTSISLNNRYLKLERENTGTIDETYSTDLRFNYLTKDKLKFSFDIGYVDRDSTDDERDVRNARAALSVTYHFL